MSSLTSDILGTKPRMLLPVTVLSVVAPSADFHSSLFRGVCVTTIVLSGFGYDFWTSKIPLLGLPGLMTAWPSSVTRQLLTIWSHQ